MRSVEFKIIKYFNTYFRLPINNPAILTQWLREVQKKNISLQSDLYTIKVNMFYHTCNRVCNVF